MRVMQDANVRQESAYFGQIVPLLGKTEKGYELGNKVGRFLSFLWIKSKSCGDKNLSIYF